MNLHQALCESDYSRAYCFPDLPVYDHHVYLAVMENGLILLYAYDTVFGTYTRLHSINNMEGSWRPVATVSPIYTKANISQIDSQGDDEDE